MPPPDPRDIVSTRRFEQSPEQVFAALADPARLARWWGPAGFSNRFEVCRFETGGDWRFTMVGPDGTEYANECVFTAIEAPGRVVVDHLGAPRFTLTMTLGDEAGGTRVTWVQRFDTVATREQVAAVCVPANEQNFDRWQAELRRPA